MAKIDHKAIHQALQRLGLVVLAAMLGLGIGEALLRVLYPRMVGSYQGLYALDPDVGYKLWPGLDVLYATSEYRVPVRANHFGFRGREYPSDKPAGVYRIMILGDSMVEALQVPLEATFHQQLEAQLNEGSGHRPVEVMAFGVGGYGLIQEYMAWRVYGRTIQPDLVILLSVSNDFESELAALTYPISLAQVRDLIQIRAASLYGPWWAQWYRSLHVYTLLRNALYQDPRIRAASGRIAEWLFGGHGRQPWLQPDLWTSLVAGRSFDAAQEVIWEGYLRLVRELDLEVKAAGARLLVVSAPLSEQLNPQQLAVQLQLFRFDPQVAEPDRPDVLLGQRLEQSGVHYLSLAPYFRTSGSARSPLFFRYDRHWTAAGHQAVAEALRRYLASHRNLFLLREKGPPS